MRRCSVTDRSRSEVVQSTSEQQAMNHCDGETMSPADHYMDSSPPQLEQQQNSEDAQHQLNGTRPSFQENEKTEIYEAEQSSLESSAKPWWLSSFFYPKPILFGTWDGVFTSCMINMFGVVVFLRIGWMVGHAGIGYSLVIVFIVEIMALVTILSSIGVCEKCHLDSGGIYSLLSHVLGNRIGASIGIIYCFGQAVACSLCVLAFGESILDMLNMHDDVWITRAIAAGLLVILVGINVAGVLWVIGLQVIFVFLLFVAVLDFVLGSFLRTDQSNGIVGYRWQTFLDNGGPSFEDGETFFTVLGVFFPAVCGAFGGFNMSGDLKDPRTNISVGTLTAVAVCAAIYVVFVLILGATCDRSSLQTDFMIADKISATRIFWIIGLYELSISSAAGNISGPPYIIQAMAADHACRASEPIASGRGPNKIPVFATLVFAIISLVFIFIGQLNTLGPVLTMPFLLTYASVDYAYFVLITTLESKKNREKRIEFEQTESSALHQNHKGYGTLDSRNSNSSPSELTDYDLDSLFPSERLTDSGESSCLTKNSAATCSPRRESLSPSDIGNAVPESHGATKMETSGVERRNSKDDNSNASNAMKTKTSSLPSRCCNRWLSLLGAIVNIVAMFGIQWQYALANVITAVLLWLFIGMTNACLYPGIGEFSLLGWAYNRLRAICYRVRHRKKWESANSKRIVMKENGAIFQTTPGRISEENDDFADRERYHQTQVVGLELFPLHGDNS